MSSPGIVRRGATVDAADRALLDDLSQTHRVSLSEVVRAGIALLRALPEAELVRALRAAGPPPPARAGISSLSTSMPPAEADALEALVEQIERVGDEQLNPSFSLLIRVGLRRLADLDAAAQRAALEAVERLPTGRRPRR